MLCRRCKEAMCADCLAIANEYEDLLARAQRSRMQQDEATISLQAQLDQANRRAEAFEQLAKLGYPEVITKWMDDFVASRVGGPQQGPPTAPVNAKRD